MSRVAAFSVGKMRDRVQIQQATETIDAAGQVIRTWATLYADQPARWVPMRGEESQRGGQVEAQVDDVFEIRYRTGITPQMQLIHRGRTYGIVYVRERNGRLRYLELSVKAVI